MMDDPTFDKEKIKDLLEKHPNGIWQPTFWETSVNSLNKQPQQTVPNGRFVCFQWWGYLTGKDLADNGVKGITRKQMDSRLVAQIG